LPASASRLNPEPTPTSSTESSHFRTLDDRLEISGSGRSFTSRSPASTLDFVLNRELRGSARSPSVQWADTPRRRSKAGIGRDAAIGELIEERADIDQLRRTQINAVSRDRLADRSCAAVMQIGRGQRDIAQANGFATAADDALTLARFLDAAALQAEPIAALKLYAASRLPEVRRLARAGQLRPHLGHSRYELSCLIAALRSAPWWLHLASAIRGKLTKTALCICGVQWAGRFPKPVARQHLSDIS
jgi:hypothetical protein